MICPLFSEYAFTNFDVVHLLRGRRLALCTFPVRSWSVWQRFNVPLYSTGTYLTSGIWSYLTCHGVSIIYLFLWQCPSYDAKGPYHMPELAGVVRTGITKGRIYFSLFFLCACMSCTSRFQISPRALRHQSGPFEHGPTLFSPHLTSSLLMRSDCCARLAGESRQGTVVVERYRSGP